MSMSATVGGSARLAVFSLFFVHPNGAFYRTARQEAGKPQIPDQFLVELHLMMLTLYHIYIQCAVFSLRAHPHTQTQQRKNCGCTRADAWTKAKNINNPQPEDPNPSREPDARDANGG